MMVIGIMDKMMMRRMMMRVKMEMIRRIIT